MILMNRLLFPWGSGTRETFNELPQDQYADAGYRFRRFSPARYSGYGYLEPLDADHFMQSKDLNKAFGDVERKFEPLDIKLFELDDFRTMFKIMTDKTGCVSFDCHQVRIVVDPSKPAPAAPEGRHQDGYDYIGAFIVTRDNITGGNFMVWEDKDDEEHVFKHDLLGGYGIIDDRKYFHTGDDLNVIDPSRKGVWEWFVIGAREGR